MQAADPKKATPAPAAAAAEAAPTAKAKEEPKAAAKSSEPVVETKPASVASQADDSASVPRKLEKRDSIQLLFKFLVRIPPLFLVFVYLFIYLFVCLFDRDGTQLLAVPELATS